MFHLFAPTHPDVRTCGACDNISFIHAVCPSYDYAHLHSKQAEPAVHVRQDYPNSLICTHHIYPVQDACTTLLRTRPSGDLGETDSHRGVACAAMLSVYTEERARFVAAGPGTSSLHLPAAGGGGKGKSEPSSSSQTQDVKADLRYSLHISRLVLASWTRSHLSMLTEHTKFSSGDSLIQRTEPPICPLREPVKTFSR